MNGMKKIDFDEFGVQMPEEVKFQNIYLIGKKSI